MSLNTNMSQTNITDQVHDLKKHNGSLQIMFITKHNGSLHTKIQIHLNPNLELLKMLETLMQFQSGFQRSFSFLFHLALPFLPSLCCLPLELFCQLLFSPYNSSCYDPLDHIFCKLHLQTSLIEYMDSLTYHLSCFSSSLDDQLLVSSLVEKLVHVHSQAIVVVHLLKIKCVSRSSQMMSSYKTKDFIN